jgi:hypothetical protein
MPAAPDGRNHALKGLTDAPMRHMALVHDCHCCQIRSPSTRSFRALWIQSRSAHIMLVTLEKHADTFTERTRYRDYAISPTIFHWQSQASARPDRGDGQRIVRAQAGEGTMWLFVRRATDDEFGTEPYVFMGAFKPTSIEGMQPMSVTGELANPMPAEWFEIAARAR